MIDLQTAETAIYGHVYKDKALGAREGSLISEIASTLSVAGTKSHEESAEVFMNYVNSVEEHTACMTEAKEQIVRSVRQLCDYVKNTVNPHIVDIVNTVNNELEGWSRTEAVFKVNKIERIVNDGFIKDLAYRFKDIPAPYGSLVGKGIGYISKDVATAALKSLNLDIDYNFNTESNVGKALSYAEDGSYENELSNPHVAMAALCLLAGIQTPQGDVEMSLTEWEIRRNALMNKAAKAIIRTHSEYQNGVDSLALYVGPRTGKVINVNKEAYHSALEKGLTPEILIGNEYLGRRYNSISLMSNDEAKEHCTNAFKVNEQARQREIQLSKDKYRAQCIQTAFESDIEKFDENDTWPVAGDSAGKARERLKSAFLKIMNGPHKHAGLDDIVAAICLLVYYSHTDAWRLIDITKRILDHDNDLSANEAYSLAKIEYVGQYLASQLTFR